MTKILFSALRGLVLLAFLTASLGSSPSAPAAQAPEWQAKVDGWVLATAEQGETEFIVMLAEQADLSRADRLPTKEQKGRYVYEQLTRTAGKAQQPVLQALQTLKVDSTAPLEYQPFWVANMIWVRGDRRVVQAMAQRSDVAHLYANPQVKLETPQPGAAPHAPAAADETIIERSLQVIHAPEVWAAGYTGQGIVIGGQDTGYDWDHPALQDKYRGWDGATADHNYNWHDAIHSGGGVCGPDSLVPCDDGYHGTHTLGTMVGEGYDTSGDLRQFGVAPGARWIGCRNMDRGFGTPATYSECFQWFIAPTNLSGQEPRPDLAPDIINNSWHCPVSEGCTDVNVLLAVVNNVRAAGILTVQSAGNSGPTCSTIRSPAGIYDASFTIGATDNNDLIASFSSRGPVSVDGSNRLKPDVSAPGVSIFSTQPGGGYRYLSGTSMAAPHVAGLAALLLSARPDLRGHVDLIETFIQQGAKTLTSSEICGGVPGSQVPNNTYGWGRIDALQSFTDALLILRKEASSLFYDPGDVITFTLQVANQRPLETLHNLRITDTLPANVTFIDATLPHTLANGQVTWSFPELGPGQSQSLELVIQTPLDASGAILNQDFFASSDEAARVTGPAVWVYLGRPIYFPTILKQFSSLTEPLHSP
jgi:uncharacterized repeat protein (TIGR01451 family)